MQHMMCACGDDTPSQALFPRIRRLSFSETPAPRAPTRDPKRL